MASLKVLRQMNWRYILSTVVAGAAASGLSFAGLGAAGVDGAAQVVGTGATGTGAVLAFLAFVASKLLADADGDKRLAAADVDDNDAAVQ